MSRMPMKEAPWRLVLSKALLMRCTSQRNNRSYVALARASTAKSACVTNTQRQDTHGQTKSEWGLIMMKEWIMDKNKKRQTLLISSNGVKTEWDRVEKPQEKKKINLIKTPLVIGRKHKTCDGSAMCERAGGKESWQSWRSQSHEDRFSSASLCSSHWWTLMRVTGMSNTRGETKLN